MEHKLAAVACYLKLLNYCCWLEVKSSVVPADWATYVLLQQVGVAG